MLVERNLILASRWLNINKIFGFEIQGLLKIGIRGVTVSDVRGFGAQGGSMERHGGKFLVPVHSFHFQPKLQDLTNRIALFKFQS